MGAVLFINKWILGLFFFFPGAHPYHVSATEIEYEAKTKRLEISTKIFTDDFENILGKKYPQKIDLSNQHIRPKMNDLIDKYIKSHLVIKSDGKVLPLKLYGWEIDHEAVIVYTTAEAASFNPKAIIIENSVLYDLFEDQINIVHFIYKGQRKSSKLTYPDSKLQISF